MTQRSPARPLFAEDALFRICRGSGLLTVTLRQRIETKGYPMRMTESEV